MRWSAISPALYSNVGRPSIAPQLLLRAMLLQAFYSVRSERQLMERMEFRPAVPLVCRPSVRTSWCGTIRSSRRIATGCWKALSPSRFLATLLARPKVKRLLSSDHFQRRWHADPGLVLDEELQAS